MNSIADGSCLHLNYLLEFLAAWEKRPAYLTPMAYQWCSAISEAAGGFDPSETTIDLPYTQKVILKSQVRLRPQDLPSYWAKQGFPAVGPCYDPVCLDDTSHHARRHPQRLTPRMYAHLLFITLDVGFRHVTPGRDQPVLHLDHTSHYEWVFKTAFTSDRDDVIADAMCVWIAGGDSKLPGSYARYLAKRVESGTPFSPRLRQVSIHVIEWIWHKALEVPGLDTIHWLNHLNINADDVVDGENWARLLVGVMRSPTGPESFSSHYWHLLAKLVASKHFLRLESRDVEVMRSLEKAEDWEKLGVWMVAVWSGLPGSESMEGIEEVTLKLLSQRPSAFPRFEDLCKAFTCLAPDCQAHKNKLQQICDQVRVRQLLPYVSVRPAHDLSVLTPPFFTSGNRFTPRKFFSCLLWETTASESFYRMYHGLIYRVRTCFLVYTEKIMISQTQLVTQGDEGALRAPSCHYTRGWYARSRGCRTRFGIQSRLNDPNLAR